MLLAILGALDIACAISIILNLKFFAFYFFVALLIKGIYSIFSSIASQCYITFILGFIDAFAAMSLYFISKEMIFLIPPYIIGIILFIKGLYSLSVNFRL
jgi:hypothetical protein